MKKRFGAVFIAQAGAIAALYVVLTYLCNILGLANNVIQVRFSEALTILPIFTPAAIPGLAIGCLISNIVNGCIIWDIVFGTIATLIGAVGTYLLRRVKWLGPIPPILANAIVVPLVLIYGYQVPDAYFFCVATVTAGEVISCGVLGILLMLGLWRVRYTLFPALAYDPVMTPPSKKSVNEAPAGSHTNA